VGGAVDRAWLAARSLVSSGAGLLHRCGAALSNVGLWRDLVVVGPRALGLVERSATGRSRGRSETEGSPARPRSLRLAAHAAVDEILVALVKSARRPLSVGDAERVRTETLEALELFGRCGLLDRPAEYHRTPPPPAAVRIAPAGAPGLRFEELVWASGYEPPVGEPGRERWMGFEANHTAYARMLRHPGGPRPWLVCIPGAGMGNAALDLAVFRAARLHKTLGLNVALPVLPRHGPRKAGEALDIRFPSEDLLDNVHGLAQAVWDIRGLLSWLRAEEAEAIGIQGVSLGAYVAALCAAFDDDLACVIAGVPASDLSALFRHHIPPVRRGPSPHLTQEAHLVHKVVSPLALRPLVPTERRFIFAGLADRMAHPVHQVHELWLHWDRPRIAWYAGSHMGFVRSRVVREFVSRALEESGLVR